jgi:hypothetical protein
MQALGGSFQLMATYRMDLDQAGHLNRHKKGANKSFVHLFFESHIVVVDLFILCAARTFYSYDL